MKPSIRSASHETGTLIITDSRMGPFFEEKVGVSFLGKNVPGIDMRRGEFAYRVVNSGVANALVKAQRFAQSLRYVKIYPIIRHGEDDSWRGWDSKLHAILWNVSPLSGNAASALTWNISVLAPGDVSDEQVAELIIATLAADGYHATITRVDDVYAMRVHKKN